MLKICAAVAILNLCLCVSVRNCFAAGTTAPDVNVYSLADDLYRAISIGGEIRVVKVTHIAPASNPKIPDSLAIGVVSLDVVATLLGPDKKTMQLPYMYPKPKPEGGYIDFTPIWPDLTDVADGQELLCVSVPGASEPAYSDKAIGDGAACRVVPVPGLDAPEMKDYREIARLNRMTDFTASLGALKTDARDGDDIMRQYSIEALGDTTAQKDADAAVIALGDMLKAGSNARLSDKEYALVLENLVAALGRFAPHSDATRELVESALVEAALAEKDSKNLRDRCLQSLEAITTSANIPAKNVLGDEQVSAFKQMLDANYAQASNDNLWAIKRWIGR